MKSAVDTNILLDVFLPDPEFGPSSKAFLEKKYAAGLLLVCDVVYSELASFFPSHTLLQKALSPLGIRLFPMDEDTCYTAGQIFAKYKKKGGKRTRVLADFMIAAHAQKFADALITRDRGFYRNYFPRLKILEP